MIAPERHGDFVGRERELDAIWKVIRREADRQVLFVVAPEGFGKSRLLNELRDQCRAKKLDHAWCDLAETGDHPYLDVTQTIAAELGPDDFEDFERTFESLANSNDTLVEANKQAIKQLLDLITSINASASGGNVQTIERSTIHGDVVAGNLINIGKLVLETDDQDPGQYKEKLIENLISAALEKSLKNASTKRPIVLIFDNWDRASSKTWQWFNMALLDWLIEEKLPKAVAIVASRDIKELPQEGRFVQIMELPPLDKDDVRNYWTRNRGLDEQYVERAYDVSKGRPFALEQLADCRTANPAEEFWDELSIDCLLDTLSAPVAEAVRLGAIPYQFDLSLSAQLADPSSDAKAIGEEVIEVLKSWSFAVELPSGHAHFRYNEEVRRALFDWWQGRRPDDFRAAHQKLHSYYTELARQAGEGERQGYEYEALYHQLIADEPAGLQTLRTRFEIDREARRTSVVERLVKRHELDSLLGKDGQHWLRYFRATLEVVHRQGRPDQEFDSLTKVDNRIIRGLAYRGLGDFHVWQGHWATAIDAYRNSLKQFSTEAEPQLIARVMLTIGSVYRTMADLHARTPVEDGEVLGLSGSFFTRFQLFPIQVYQWLLHRIGFLPPLYAGTNYQEWLVAYLRLRANRWYRDAEKQFIAIEDDHGATHARLFIAEIEHQLGRWSWARRSYERLLDPAITPEVLGNEYHIAQVHLGMGRAQLAEGKFTEAQDTLSDALPVFLDKRDFRRAGITTDLSGRSYLAQGQVDRGANMLLESANLFDRDGSFVEHTQMLYQLAALPEKYEVSADTREKIGKYLTHRKERHYVTPFPERVLRSFRRLVILIVLPLTAILAVGVSIAVFTPFLVAESEIVLGRLPSIFREVIIHVMVATVPLPFSLWLFRLIYSLLGTFVARGTGRNLKAIEKEQPRRYVTDEYGLSFYRHSFDQQQKIAWDDVTRFVRIGILQRRQQIDLLSGMVLAGKRGLPLIINGPTSNYAQLSQDIETHLEDRVQPRILNLVLFDWRWLLPAVVGALGFGIVLTAIGLLVSTTEDLETGQIESAPVTGIMAVALVTLLVVLPALLLWRLVFHERAVRQEAQQSLYRLPYWAYWAAAIISSALALLWIIILPVLLAQE